MRGHSMYTSCSARMGCYCGGVSLFLLFLSLCAFPRVESALKSEAAIEKHSSGMYICKQVSPTGNLSSSAAVTLSPENPKYSLACLGGDFEFMPLDGAQGPALTVCASTSKTKDECERNQLALQDVLPKATNEWYAIEGNPRHVPGDVKYDFTIPPDGFPHAQQVFNVGCRSIYGAYCFLTVTVQPMAAAVTGKKVSCAYQEPGPASLSVSLSENDNSFTLVCGTSHFPQPSTYSTQYCSGSSVAPSTCAPKALTALIPGFDAAWWQGNQGTEQGVTLTIPKDKFPPTGQEFLTGCSRDESGGPYCNVKVSVAAASTRTSTTTAKPSAGVSHISNIAAAGVASVLAFVFSVAV